MHSRILSGRKVIGVLLISFLLCATALGVLRQRIQSDLDSCALRHRPPIHIQATTSRRRSITSPMRIPSVNAIMLSGHLGRRDRRALPVLEGYLTGESCDHARDLCQSE